MTFLQLADTHKKDLASFQGGESIFVWGHDTVADQMWFLDEDTAKEQRPFVKQQVVCPVPGCGAKLTTAHRSKKRDGLVHYSGTGGHSKESVFHSQGCALIEGWLREKYPNSHAQREEYTNESGERRADVLLTADTGERVAFEVQYSALTPDAWQRRHDSYREQGIVDVWLFGHTGAQLKIDKDGILKRNPTHDAVIRSGSALMFINPIEQMIGIVSDVELAYDAETDDYSGREYDVWDSLGHEPELKIVVLSGLEATRWKGLRGGWLGHLYSQTAELREHNNSERARRAQIEETQRKAAEAKKRVAEAKQKSWEARRIPQQYRIRIGLRDKGRWSRSEALAEIITYFDGYRRNRIDLINDPGAAPGLLLRWQCVIYFSLIAGQAKPFGTTNAVQALKTHRIATGQTDLFRTTTRWLYELETEGYLERAQSDTKYPAWQPTISGAWW